MLYTTLGRTNRKVSRIGFGGCPAGVKNYVETYDPGKTDDYGEGFAQPDVPTNWVLTTLIPPPAMVMA